MRDELRILLRTLRKSAKISVALAAKRAFVDERTWRSWETLKGAKYDRQPSEKALWSFFQRSGIEIPPEFTARPNGKPLGRVLSITSYKGGVGKSPITINVAAQLAAQHLKVAVVTDDGVFRGMCHDGRGPATGTQVSKIDFYDELDLVTSPADLKKMKKEIREHVTHLPIEEQQMGRFIYGHVFKAIERKALATERLSDLITRYDYVFLDINVKTELIRRHADLVAIVLDSNCYYSIQSAEAFLAAQRAIKCRKATPAFFGLITNCDVGGVSRELQEFVGDLPGLSDETRDDLQQAKREIYLRRERLSQLIHKLDLPMLTTEMTASHKIAIELYNEGRNFLDGYCYFHSLIDIAPHSPAASEIRRLTSELINYRV
ncbi:chromosome partitioning protein [Pseudomonas sp. JAI115]|uniref:ParA family protein n=1 Tax=Pseudomonas sp. JAI115 TaxID=2723061 RepID=UPI00160B4C56|nr:AAA family ATPase [Pseudomonas sp. JAI115]MBB6157395.1 chromosome partitioning protein [Pseudomonas sp. JAI115]